jgi:hypothetical protein
VRSCAVELLGSIGEPIATSVLIDSLKDPVYQIRGFAAVALGKVDITDAQLNSIINLLYEGKTWQSRQGAAEALFNIENPKSISALSRAIGDEDVRVRNLAVRALGKLFEKCINLEQIIDFEKALHDSIKHLNKKTKSKEKMSGIHIKLARLKMLVAAKRDQLTKDNGILLDDKLKPPKKGRLYQRLKRALNG